MDTGQEQSSAANPGARLQTARVRAGWSLASAAARLRLPPDTLAALEAGEFQGLGASVIVRGHLRRYAELVGVPGHEILTAYEAWSGRLSSQPDLRRVITDPAVRASVRGYALRPWHALIAAIVVVLLALVSWAGHYAPRMASLETPVGVAPLPDQTP